MEQIILCWHSLAQLWNSLPTTVGQERSNARGVAENSRKLRCDVANGHDFGMPNLTTAAPSQPGTPSHVYKRRSWYLGGYVRRTTGKPKQALTN